MTYSATTRLSEMTDSRVQWLEDRVVDILRVSSATFKQLLDHSAGDGQYRYVRHCALPLQLPLRARS